MGLGGRLRALFSRSAVDGAFFEELEDTLISGDIGPATADQVIASLRQEGAGRDQEGFILRLRELLGAYLKVERLSLGAGRPNVFLVLGVNGVGKTTTIAKLADYYRRQNGVRPLLAAGDTFRAAAIEQLALWGERLRVPVVRQQPGSDPGAVLYDAIVSARARDYQLVLADTAGRLHNKAHLVGELAKIDKVVRGRLEGGTYKKLLVLDATTGQNALRQAEVFHEAVGVDSVVLAKYDSTAKGGIVVTICRQLGLPFSFLGTGEKLADLVPFDVERFLDRLLAPE